MKLALRLILLFGAIILCQQWVLAQDQASTITSASGARIQLEKCSDPRADSTARCGKYEVYEDRATRTGRKIALNVMVLPATGVKAQPDPLFFLAGGPGQSAVAIATESGNKFFTEVRKQRDIVLVDQRGTGRSHPLNCVMNNGPADLTTYFWDELFPAEKLRVCRAALEKDANLALYTTSNAMDDLDDVRAALGYERINVYGGSYGTNAAFVYLRQHPDRVRSIVVSGVAPVDYKFPLAWSKGVQHAMDRLFEDCAADETCNKAFPRLRDEFASVLKQLDKGAVTFELPNPATNQNQSVKLTRSSFNEHLRSMLYSPEFARLLPLLIHAAAEGEYELFGGTVIEYSQLLKGPGNQISIGMHLSVVCGEHVPFITESEISRETAGTFYGERRLRDQIKACENWPRSKTSSDFIIPVKSNAPVLLISGDLDPVAPPWLAAAAAKSLPNATHIIARNTSHFSGSACIDKLITKFIEQGSAQGLDTSCVSEIKRPMFITPEMAMKMAGAGPALDSSHGLEEWDGVLDAGSAKLRLTLRLAKDAKDRWSGELISIDQGNIKLPIDSLKYENGTITFDVKVAGGTFEGTVTADGKEIHGRWKQGPLNAPTNFKRK